ncbi:ClpXP protease specificity-enhancing factor [Oceanicoccus sp. KOV_DT_Chl]|uniref:ClpXP protease specificity-enhancing factor n=1 Tax=Oceanicoccus sp. KOV_DT_Chl TaxID=1904639 RepID=UPI000C7CADBB|nr:ClpXP protease specificity-enhancing factor [Oceanicoccus sp. KOV_DT_Chl]
MAMTSSRPYIVRALYEWILENDCTPYILINAMADGVQVPQQYVKNGQIVLNISPTAVMDLLLTNEAMNFNGRFGGVPMDIYAPMTAVMGIYARENGQGMIFELDDPTEPPPGGDDPAPKAKPKSDAKVTALGNKKPGLRVVK